MLKEMHLVVLMRDNIRPNIPPNYLALGPKDQTELSPELAPTGI